MLSPIEDKKLTTRDLLNHDQNDIVQTYIDISDPYHIIKNHEHDWLLLPVPISDLYFRLTQSQVKILFAGIPLGHYKGKDWFPNHGLAMSYLGTNPLTLIMSQNYSIKCLTLVKRKYRSDIGTRKG